MEKADNHPSGGIFANKGVTIAFTIILPGIIAVTTVVREMIEGRNAVELQERSQLHEIRRNYLDLVLRVEENSFRQERLLRFLLLVNDDPELRQWADSELKLVAGMNESVQRADSLARTVSTTAANAVSERRVSRILDSLDRDIALKALKIGIVSQSAQQVLARANLPPDVQCQEATLRAEPASGLSACQASLRNRTTRVSALRKDGDRWSWSVSRNPLVQSLRLQGLGQEPEPDDIRCECRESAR
jgi:hypothetical protein